MSIEKCVEVCVHALKSRGYLTGDDVSDGLLAPDAGENMPAGRRNQGHLHGLDASLRSLHTAALACGQRRPATL